MNDYDVVTRALIEGAKQKAVFRRTVLRKLTIFADDLKREKETPVNLPLYAIEWRERLTYDQFLEKYGVKPLLSHQIPQCHICTRFDTADNPLFAYAVYMSGNDYKLIWRCIKGHIHDHGMVFMDVQTGMRVHC